MERLGQSSLVGVIRYPRPGVVPVVPGGAELEGARRLWELHDHLRRKTDTELASELFGV